MALGILVKGINNIPNTVKALIINVNVLMLKGKRALYILINSRA